MAGVDYEQGTIDVCPTAATELRQDGDGPLRTWWNMGQFAVAESQHDQPSTVRKPRRS